MQLRQAYTRHAHERHAYVSGYTTWRCRRHNYLDVAKSLWFEGFNILSPHALHLPVCRSKKAMPPLPQLGNDVLDRTIRNIEQAQGRPRHHTTAADILQV